MAKYEKYERKIAYLFWLIVLANFGFAVRRHYEQIRPGTPPQIAIRNAIELAWFMETKWLFFFLNIFFGAVFFYVLYQKRGSLFPQRLNPEPSPRFAKKTIAQPSDPVILQHWVSVVRRANTGTPENIRLAILEADALVDTFLKKRGYEGDTLADRLKHFSPDQIKTLDELWRSHKIRNHIAHTPGFTISTKEAEVAILGFRNFLKELGAF